MVEVLEESETKQSNTPVSSIIIKSGHQDMKGIFKDLIHQEAELTTEESNEKTTTEKQINYVELESTFSGAAAKTEES